MKARTVLTAVLSIVSLVIFVAAVVSIPTAHDQSTSSHNEAIPNRGQLTMLETDQQMLNLMRAEVSANMKNMTHHNPMWTDPSMIRLQEQYQVQLDRMIARRSG